MLITSDDKAFHRLRQDLPFFAAALLRIRAKTAEQGDKIVPFRLNRAQLYLHGELERQRQETGRVRALVLKGRQQGCSTYVAARYFHRTIFQRGIKTFIMAHQDDATTNLFTIVRRYYASVCDFAPVPPKTRYSNRKELIFEGLDSAYALATAGSENSGRSDTIDLFHGSEVAFWKNTDGIRTGAMQAAGMAREIILESTANGFDSMFFPMWQDAEAGKGEYRAIFIPWYWQNEYAKPVPPDFVLDREEADYASRFGLSREQMAWRRDKLVELREPALFMQEYPSTAAEAFQITGVESFISPEKVLRARKYTAPEAVGPHYLGVDPAREGRDRTALIHRIGRCAFGLEFMNTPDTMHIVGKVADILSRETPRPVDCAFIDHSGGMGAAIYDRLVELGYGNRIVLVNFGSRTSLLHPDLYVNKRAEMWGELREWLNDESGVDIPDRDDLQADLTAPSFSFDSEQRVLLEKKEDLKKRGLRSPDGADALALTFAGGRRGDAGRPSGIRKKRIMVV